MGDAHKKAKGPLEQVHRMVRRAAVRVFDRHTLGIWAGCSALAAFSGPFGTYRHHSFFSALVVWSVLLGFAIITAFFVYELCSIVFSRQTPAQINLSFVAFGSTAVALVIDSLLTYWLDRPGTVRPDFWELWVYVIAIMFIVILVRRVLPGFDDALSEHGAMRTKNLPPASLPPHSRLAQRLDIPQGTRIAHISANGHFIEVITCEQSHSIRMRFSDAVAELDETVGLTVHRSHWVHRDAIRGWVPHAAKPYLVLENGTQVPISKTYFSKVEAVGLAVLGTAVA